MTARTAPRRTPAPVDRVGFRLRSTATLADLMRFHRHSNRSLADRVGVSPSVIAQLRTGRRTTASPDNARNIEGALQVPPGMLFTPQVFSVGVSTTRPAANTKRPTARGRFRR